MTLTPTDSSNPLSSKSVKRGNFKVILYVIVAFSIYFSIDELYFNTIQIYLRKFIPGILIPFIVAYLLIGIPLFIATWLINRRKNILGSLGLMGNPWIGILFAFICTLPMFIGYAYLAGGLVSGLSVTVLIADNLLAGFFEEIYFRGFLFGQLFRNSRLGFLPSILLCSALFASVHLYQSTDPMVLFGILSTTFFGSILFAWLYVEWGYNIWVPISLHSLMNTSWYIFGTGENALGDIGANVFRLVTIVLAISLTILYKRRTRQRYEINKSTLWWKKVPDMSTVQSDTSKLNNSISDFI